jgi:hypothetical protein
MLIVELAAAYMQSREEFGLLHCVTDWSEE